MVVDNLHLRGDLGVVQLGTPDDEKIPGDHMWPTCGPEVRNSDAPQRAMDVKGEQPDEDHRSRHVVHVHAEEPHRQGKVG